MTFHDQIQKHPWEKVREQIASRTSEDVRLAMPPFPNWYRGRDDVITFLRTWIMPSGSFRLSTVTNSVSGESRNATRIPCRSTPSRSPVDSGPIARAVSPAHGPPAALREEAAEGVAQPIPVVDAIGRI